MATALGFALVLVIAVPIRSGDAQAQAGGPWSTRAPLNDARQEVAVAALEGSVYVIGGLRADLTTADTVEVYDPSNDAWTFAAPLPIPLHHTTAAPANGKLYVVGGLTGRTFTPVDTTLEYDPASDTWTPKTRMPTARGSLAVAVLDGRIYAAGGSPAARENDFAVYDPTADDWTVLPDMPTARNHLAAGSLGGKFYAVGGRSGGIGGILATLEQFDPATGVWTPRAPMPTARGGIAGAVARGRLLVFGGEGNSGDPSGVFEEVEAYDPTTNSWATLPPMPTPRHGIGAATVGGLIHIPGGAPVEGLGVTAVHEVLDPECQAEPAGTVCDDGNACTSPDQCDGAGACIPGACQIGAVCGSLCATALTCRDTSGLCECGAP